MPFFKNYPLAEYYFGEEDYKVKFPNLTQYTNIIDAVKLNSSFYTYYNIQRGDRPDNVSQELYKTPEYHWTFFLMNDNIRESGWPLGELELEAKVNETHPNTVITTLDEIYSDFLVGSVVTGVESEATGTIIHRNIQLGQLFIEGTMEFTDGELLICTEDEIEKSITVYGNTTESDAALFYRDPTETYTVDINPFEGPGTNVKTSYYDHYYDTNESLKQIRVIKPGSIVQVVTEFRKVMSDG